MEDQWCSAPTLSGEGGGGRGQDSNSLTETIGNMVIY